MKRMLFVFNPATGGGKLKGRLMEMLCRFSAAGYELSVWPTAAAGHARKIVRKHAPGCDLVVCCGGDGTFSEVVDGLQNVRPMPLLGYIPGGTTNDFAGSLQIPKSDLLKAVDRILEPNRIFECDIGTFNGRAFTYVAAFGAFTDVSYKTPQNVKNALGYFAYLLEAVQRLPGLAPCRARFSCDSGAAFEGEYLLGMVANSLSVAGFSMMKKDLVKMDDGLFEVLLVRHPHNLGELGEISSALLSRNFSSPLLHVAQVHELRFESDSPIAWTLDGEFGGAVQEADISVREKAMRICI